MATATRKRTTKTAKPKVKMQIIRVPYPVPKVSVIDQMRQSAFDSEGSKNCRQLIALLKRVAKFAGRLGFDKVEDALIDIAREDLECYLPQNPDEVEALEALANLD